MTNLNNYVNLHPGTAGPTPFGPITLRAFGSGSGMRGLPGDFTPPSRFVRAAFLKTFALEQDTGEKSIEQAFHILNNVDIPSGVQFAVGKSPTDMPAATQWTIATDLKNKIIYYHTMYNRTIRNLDMNKIDFATVGITRVLTITPNKLKAPHKRLDLTRLNLFDKTTEQIALGASVEPFTKTTQIARKNAKKSRGVSIFVQKFIKPPIFKV
jgi:penicillin V acylase-like amidase (Ntn superfamily)